MNREDALKFFNEVKGRKIRRDGWRKGHYFIPKTLETSSTLTGVYKSGTIEMDNTLTIREGFKPDSRGHYWELIENIDDYLDTFKNGKG